ncbi:MAG: ornithine cyclodeaminase [Prevotellaceae bacterium]|jgi:ornithine cyclodeaminase/alanine dehydrogenase-like protein (mu-crystallin family)|nr:ornithine cyclodeaminase [Prevotellaceae bacterium]
MKIIDHNAISSLNISPALCVSWVEEAFKLKYNVELPAKISIKQPGSIFFNTMPCLIPSINRFGVKEVYRYPHNTPSLLSEILLYDTAEGKLLALMDAAWITAMRTGAVAALSILTLRSANAKRYAFMGLGNTARATLLCLLESAKEEHFEIRLLAYKGQEHEFIQRFQSYPNASFTIAASAAALIQGADVVVSCITSAEEQIAPDETFKEGVLLVPVHTRGFQNCDLFFDKIAADDTAHVQEFKHFNKFKSFVELSAVLLGKNKGRTADKERIIAYNIGIALHDIYFASKIYNLLMSSASPTFKEHSLSAPACKFWM